MCTSGSERTVKPMPGFGTCVTKSLLCRNPVQLPMPLTPVTHLPSRLCQQHLSKLSLQILKSLQNILRHLTKTFRHSKASMIQYHSEQRKKRVAPEQKSPHANKYVNSKGSFNSY